MAEHLFDWALAELSITNPRAHAKLSGVLDGPGFANPHHITYSQGWRRGERAATARAERAMIAANRRRWRFVARHFRDTWAGRG